MGRSQLLQSAVVLSAVALLSTCATAPQRTRLGARAGAYLQRHPATVPEVADALQRGHVIVGMDREQVAISVGPPLSKRIFHREPQTEVWLYPSARFHQQQSSHGASTARVAFVHGRVATVDFY